VGSDRGDHVAGVGVRQDEAGGRDVEPEAEQRRDQEQRREGGEAERLFHVDREQEQQQRERQVRHQQEVEQPRRDRREQHQQDEHQPHHQGEVALRAEDLAQRADHACSSTRAGAFFA
jgi:hypothetical protein